MTKQEEIREGMARHFGFCVVNEQDFYEAADELIAYLHSQGLVIKVDKELPERTWYKDWGGESGEAGYNLALEDKAGYVAVESLISK